jgi:spore germination cell wall hydrolase CwlJ-like protein
VIALLAKKITGYLLLAWFGFYSLGLPLGLILNQQSVRHRSLPKTSQAVGPQKGRTQSQIAGNRLADTPPKVIPALPVTLEKNEAQGTKVPAVNATWKSAQPVQGTTGAVAGNVSSKPQTAAVSSYQYQMLARIISAEAKGEPFHGQVAVGAVILNRVASARFPKSIAANVLKRGQFEPVANGSIWNEPTPSAYRAARLALNGWDPTGGALYFFNPAKTSSRWIWSRPVVTRIGDHVFAV